MSGDVSSCMEQLKVYCTSWYQAMVAALLYTEPAVKFYELGYHAHRYVQHYGGTANLNFCDATVLALFEFDLHAVRIPFSVQMILNLYLQHINIENTVLNAHLNDSLSRLSKSFSWLLMVVGWQHI